MTTTSRQVIVGNSIILEIDIRDAVGNVVDPDTTPQVEIIDGSDMIVRAMSASGLVRVSVGRFRLTYAVPTTARTGIWVDHWTATVDGLATQAYLNFIVLTESAAIAAAAAIGDAPEITYTHDEIIGINILLSLLNKRLKNELQMESVDAYGNIEFVNCSVFSNDELVAFLNMSLSEFNSCPHFSDFSFADEVIYNRYAYVIVEGACIVAWAAQMVIEAGREFNVTDNGINLIPPPLSTALNNELSNFWTAHREVLKMIKTSIKPHPRGFGSFRCLATSPSLLKLRHLRERRII